MRRRLLALVCAVIILSCIDEKDYDFGEVALSPELAIPLAFGDLGLLNMITRKDSSYIRSYADGLLYFYYSKTLASTEIHDLFSLPDNNSTVSFSLLPGVLPASSMETVVGTINGQIDLSLSPEKLTEILLKTGTLNYSVGLSQNTSPPNLPLEAVVTLTDVVQKTTGQPLAFRASNGSGSKPLKDYLIQTINNRFAFRADLIIKPHPTTFIPVGTNANVQLNFVDMDFAHIKGFLGDQFIPIPLQSMELSVFNSTLKGASVSLVQPVITMQVVNDYGSTCELNFTTLHAAKPGSTLPFQISPSNPINLNSPATLGLSATTNIGISNQQSIMNFGPHQLDYAVTARINKGLTNATNFLSDTSKLRINLTAEMPIYGRVSDITISDTLNIDLGSLDGSKVQSSSLKINGRNEMPLDVNLQIYLADKNYQIIDSVFASNQTYIIKASSVSASGELLAAGITDVRSGLDAEKLSKLFESQFLILKATMNTARDQNGPQLNVKFKSSYRLKLNIGLLARFNITLK